MINMKLSEQLFGEGVGWRNRSILWAPWDIVWTMVSIPLVMLYILVRLPDQVVREMWAKRQYDKRRALAGRE